MKKAFVIVLLALATAFGASVTIPDFRNGELSPYMEGRTDTLQYLNGLRELENMMLETQGGAEKRPGTYFIDGAAGTTPQRTPDSNLRDEATVMANDNSVVFFDSDYDELLYSADIGNICEAVAVTSDGIVIAGGANAGTGSCITRWDADMNVDINFYARDPVWGPVSTINRMELSPDGFYLYARNARNLIKFNVATGDQIYIKDLTNGFGNMKIDTDGTIWAQIDWWLYHLDEDGEELAQIGFLGHTTKDGYLDEENERYYSCGVSTTYLGLPLFQVAAINLDGTNPKTFATSGSVNVWGITKIGDYIYAGGAKAEVEGETNTLWKLDTDLNLIDAWNTSDAWEGAVSYEIRGLWEDWNGNLVVRAGESTPGEEYSGLWILDTDLNFLSWHYAATDTFGAPKGSSIPFGDAGDPPDDEILDISREPVRVIDFTYRTEESYIIECGDKYMIFYKEGDA